MLRRDTDVRVAASQQSSAKTKEEAEKEEAETLNDAHEERQSAN